MDEKAGFEIILKTCEDMTHVNLRTISMITNQHDKNQHDNQSKFIYNVKMACVVNIKIVFFLCTDFVII